MKKKKIGIFTAVTAVIIVILLMVFKPFSDTTSEYNYNTVTVERGNIVNTVTATGTVEAVTSVDVGTQVSGIIDKVYVDFNDEVKQGQILAQLDEVPLKAQLQQSQATVDQAQAEFDFQKSNYDRLKALYEKQLISKSDYDQAVYNYESSKAALSNAKSAYNRSKVNLDYATIRSPIDGVVLNRAVEEGQTVAASFNTPTLFTIVNNLTQMEVQASVDEADIGKVEKGQRVEFTVDAYPDMQFNATVSQVRLQPVVTNNVVTYNVILNAPNPDKRLMPGMTASANIYVDEKSNVLTLADKALRFSPDPEVLQQVYGNMSNNNSQGASTDQGSQQGFGQGSSGRGLQQNSEGRNPAQNLQGQGFSGNGSGMGLGNSDNSSGNANLSSVWILRNDSIRPVRVVTGIDNGNEIEILSGLTEGEKVVDAMTKNGQQQAPQSASNGPPRRGFFF